MNFDNPAFFVFFAVVLALFRAVPWTAGRLVLLVASYLFYGAANPWYCLLLFGSTLVDFTVALGMSASADPARRRALLGVSLAVNIGLLGLFKYGDFGISSLNELLAWRGLAPRPLLGLVLPVGISFYTFQTLSYTIDVYRHQLEPTRDLRTFALYVSYFPQLVAGPIERARNLIPQLARKGEVSEHDLETGLRRALWGLAKKTVFADRLGLMVDQVYKAPSEAGAPVLVVTGFAFMFQLYLDFSGYTDIAIGLARMMGVRLSENFDWPFTAKNPTQFWARWHITLTSWFRDYVFTPLGGLARSHPARSILNTFVVMTLIGIWHGASWTFVVFGLLQGAMVGAHQALRLFLPRARRGPLLGRHRWSRPLAIVLTMTCVCLSGVFFRAPTLAVAGEVLAGTLTHPWEWDHQYDLHLTLVVALWCAQLYHAFATGPRRKVPLPVLPRALFLAFLILLVLYGAVDTREQFIYFQF